CPSYVTMKSGNQAHVNQDLMWRSDRTSFPVEAWAHPVWNNEQLTGGVITFIDITERLQSQRALQAAHEESELFINSVPSVLIGLDDKGRIIRWNSAAARTFSLKDAHVHGKSLASCGIQWLDRQVEEKLGLLHQIEGQV